MRNVIFASLFLIIACKETKKENGKSSETENISKINSAETEAAKRWLEKSIENYFSADISDQEKIMQNITTKGYYEFKTDATNVDMDVDGSLSLQDFQKKWKTKFDVQKAGVGVGFLITGQDWDKITITKCDAILESENTYLFDVILTDKKNNANYPIQISVFKHQNSYLIGDVLQ